MLENYMINHNEEIKLNVRFRKVESTKINDTSKKIYVESNNTQSSENESEKKSIEIEDSRQQLKPEDINFEKLPIQKLFSVPFLNCIDRFSKIERTESLIFIDFTMEKKWIDFLLQQIKYFETSTINNSFLINKNQKKINVDVVEYEKSNMYNFYIDNDSFRFTFFEEYGYVYIICGVEYLTKEKEMQKEISNIEVKKGLLNKIFRKWSL